MMIYNFFDHPFFVIMGGIATLFSLVTAIYTFFVVISGVVPVWVRLGFGLSKRKIAILAEDQFDDLHDLLVDSKIFSKKNIVKINKTAIKKASDYNLLLVHFNSFKEEIEEILRAKNDKAALIIYAPQNEGLLDPTIIQKVNQERNSIIVNMRGRLLNDILTSMITTSYD